KADKSVALGCYTDCSGAVVSSTRAEFTLEPKPTAPSDTIPKYLQSKWILMRTAEFEGMEPVHPDYPDFLLQREVAVLRAMNNVEDSRIKNPLNAMWSYFEALGIFRTEYFEFLMFLITEYHPAPNNISSFITRSKVLTGRLTDPKRKKTLQTDRTSLHHIENFIFAMRANGDHCFDWMFPNWANLQALLEYIENKPLRDVPDPSDIRDEVDDLVADQDLDEGIATEIKKQPFLGQKISTLAKVKGLWGNITSVIIALIQTPVPLPNPSKCDDAGAHMDDAIRNYNRRKYDENPDVMKGTFLEFRESRKNYRPYMIDMLEDDKRGRLKQQIRSWSMECQATATMNRTNEATNMNLSHLAVHEYKSGIHGSVFGLLFLLPTWKTDTRTTLSPPRIIGCISNRDCVLDAIGAIGIHLLDRFVWRKDLKNNADTAPDFANFDSWKDRKLFPPSHRNVDAAMHTKTVARNVQSRKEKAGIQTSRALHEGRKVAGLGALQRGAQVEDLMSIGWYQMEVGRGVYLQQIPRLDVLLKLAELEEGEVYWNPRLDVRDVEFEQSCEDLQFAFTEESPDDNVTTKISKPTLAFVIVRGLQCLAALCHRKYWKMKYTLKSWPFTHERWRSWVKRIGEAEDRLDAGYTAGDMIADDRLKADPALVAILQRVAEESKTQSQLIAQQQDLIKKLHEKIDDQNEMLRQQGLQLFELTKRSLSSTRVTPITPIKPKTTVPPVPIPSIPESNVPSAPVSSAPTTSTPTTHTAPSTLSNAIPFNLKLNSTLTASVVDSAPAAVTVPSKLKKTSLPPWCANSNTGLHESVGFYCAYDNGPFLGTIGSPIPNVLLSKDLSMIKSSLAVFHVFQKFKALDASHSGWRKANEARANSTLISKLSSIGSFISERTSSGQRDLVTVCAYLDTGKPNASQMYDAVNTMRKFDVAATKQSTPAGNRALKRKLMKTGDETEDSADPAGAKRTQTILESELNAIPGRSKEGSTDTVVEDFNKDQPTLFTPRKLVPILPKPVSSPASIQPTVEPPATKKANVGKPAKVSKPQK
ncbi:hypothetical protein HDU79_011432, partial [Rhizoclosmatium sp. JEL0117]